MSIVQVSLNTTSQFYRADVDYAGQVEILEAAIKHVEHLFESTIILARRAGVELGEPEDEGVREPLEGDGHSNSD